MSPSNDIPYVTITTDKPDVALMIIAREAVENDELELRFIDKYEPLIEFLLRILRKGFGWCEAERGEKEVPNTRCRHAASKYQRGRYVRICTGPCAKAGEEKVCTATSKIQCAHYAPDPENLISVKYVQIEKVGGARGL